MHAAVFAGVFAILYTAHLIADHWVQTHHQAEAKGTPGWPGRLACAAHVATHTLTSLAGLAALVWRTGLPLPPGPTALGLAVSAISHYAADRRTPLQRLGRLLGRGRYIQYATVLRTPAGTAQATGPGTALFHLDQSWHVCWLAIAALIIA